MSGRPTSTHEDANERFERRFTEWAALGMILSTALHFAFFTLFPTLHVEAAEGAGREIAAVNLSPVVEVPPPPEVVARPAVPKVAVVSVSEDLTIAPTTFEANPPERLPPPAGPAVSPRYKEGQPRFIPYDTPPKLLNPDVITDLWKRHYPDALRGAGIQARVVLWVHVDAHGTVVGAQVHESSGYPPIDSAALSVCEEMRFRPARNRDEPTSVWVQQALNYRTR